LSFTATFIRAQLRLLKPILNVSSIAFTRKGQEKLGKLMAETQKGKVRYLPHSFADFKGEWIIPKAKKRRGVILYLHGGGYVAGDIEYAKGFGTLLAAKNSIKVFCAAYRLAPENPFPAALDDALEAYRYLLSAGYTGKNIVLCGESAGGGLVYCLCLKLKELGLSLPSSVVAISPWTDLTMSGASFETNRRADPSMTRERLSLYASMYTREPENPFASPLYGDLTGLPTSLIFAGGDEIMLDDAAGIHKRLLEAGCESRLIITPGMWHGYVLYNMRETEKDLERIKRFISEALREKP